MAWLSFSDSDRVAGAAMPPDADTRLSPADGGLMVAVDSSAKRMTPSAFQVPPPPLPVSVRIRTFPVARSTTLSLRSAKKPSDAPSGDQNGQRAPSALSIRCAVTPSTARIHSERRPATSIVVNAIRRPSGEMEKGPS